MLGRSAFGFLKRNCLYTVAATSLAVSACASYVPISGGSGRFSGSVLVMWIGEGGSSGDGTFLYIPDPKDPLTFYRPAGANRGPVRIRPDMMYTDGGSIPKIAQMFRGLSPWGYAPAYMIHDWLFVARHCIVDRVDDSRYTALREVDFEMSAQILGEAIQTLVDTNRVQRNDIAGSAITGAVSTIVAQRLWDAEGACATSQVSEAHRATAEATVSGSRKPGRQAGARDFVAPATIVTRITF